MLESTETTELLLTHQLVPSGPIPTTNDPDGFYPYESFCESSKRPVLKNYRVVTLENEHLRVKICPDLGGRICSIFLKVAAKETLFLPRVVRPVRILPRQSFTGGGIELSFPVSHSPVQLVPVMYVVTRDRERIYVSCGERELRFGMNWTVEYSLGESDGSCPSGRSSSIRIVRLTPGCRGPMPVYPPGQTPSSISPAAPCSSMVVIFGPSTGTQKVPGANQMCAG